MKVFVGANEVASIKLDETKGEQDIQLEIPAGVTKYHVTGQGTDDDGAIVPIKGQGVFVVSSNSIRGEFESLVEQQGLIAATRKIKQRFDLML